MGHSWSAQHMQEASHEVRLNQAVGCVPLASTLYGVPSALAYHYVGDHSEASRRWAQSIPVVGNLVHMNIAVLQDDPHKQALRTLMAEVMQPQLTESTSSVCEPQLLYS